MYELSDLDTKELKARNYFAEDGHPSIEAYMQAMLSPSLYLDKLAMNLLEHGCDCPICGERYKEASFEVEKLRKISSDLPNL